MLRLCVELRKARVCCVESTSHFEEESSMQTLLAMVSLVDICDSDLTRVYDGETRTLRT